jgi:hypothetical protein
MLVTVTPLKNTADRNCPPWPCTQTFAPVFGLTIEVTTDDAEILHARRQRRAREALVILEFELNRSGVPSQIDESGAGRFR